MKARVALVGPHGVGKSTLARELVKDTSGTFGYELERLITSRERRPDEGDDEYEFVTQQQFDAQRKEYLRVQPNRGVPWYYALAPHRELADDTMRLYTVIPETAAFLRQRYVGETIVCAILPLSQEILEQRLLQRDRTIAPRELARRIELAPSDTQLARQVANIVFYNDDGLQASAALLRDTLEHHIKGEES